MPTNTPCSAVNQLFKVSLRYKKGVGVCFFAHPGTTGLRIALPTQDRQRS